MEKYILNYIKENSEDPIISKYIEYFKVELDWHFYNYGDNMSKKYLRAYKSTLTSKIQYIYKLLQSVSSRSIDNNSFKKVLTFLDIPKKSLFEAGISGYGSIFNPIGNFKSLGICQYKRLRRIINDIIYRFNFNQIVDNVSVFKYIDSHIDVLCDYYSSYGISGVFMNTDEYFINKYHLEIFKKINKPSFIFSHGLPGIYSKNVDNKSDYLLVWGEQIKLNYIKYGFDPNKIYVVGNPKYPLFPNKIKLRNTLKDVLVFTSSSVAWHQHEWFDFPIYDRSNIVLFLNSIMKVLKQNGVSHSRVRPHPSVNKNWLKKYIDPSFYTIDNKSLSDSLSSASIAIGPSSTTLLDSMVNGVNYIVYEPSEDGNKMNGNRCVPPFDGTEEYINVANSEEELDVLLRGKYQNDVRLLEKYMSPFDLKCIKKLL